MKTSKTTKSKAVNSDARSKAVNDSTVKEAPDSVKATTARAATPVMSIATASRREVTMDLIAQRAYIIWEKQGRPHGQDVQNWLLAESQLKQEIQAFTA